MEDISSKTIPYKTVKNQVSVTIEDSPPRKRIKLDQPYITKNESQPPGKNDDGFKCENKSRANVVKMKTDNDKKCEKKSRANDVKMKTDNDKKYVRRNPKQMMKR